MITVLVLGKNSYERNLDIALTARAFGASEVVYTSNKDQKLIKQVKNIVNKWGGVFSVDFIKNWKKYIKEKKNYKTIYLTMYGKPLNSTTSFVRDYKNLIIIVSSADVNKSLLQTADFNVSITNQPHCETSAIAIFLHHFYEGRELAIHFENAKYKIVPAERNIKVTRY
ncbi:MAG: tRNA (cytidine(56)-2'-O)-methyltransferase [Candidatus Micrarchaeia archaeon]